MRRLTISLDFELGWGAIEDDLWRRREAAGVYERMRDDLLRFVNRLGELDLTLTWATVGAMIGPAGEANLHHLQGTFGEKARGFADTARPETQDGRDLVAIVRACRTPQHFGSHTYSHVRFDDPEQDDATISTELRLAREACLAAGLEADALVFPRNLVGHLDAVAGAGFGIVRLPASRPTSAVGRLPGPFGRAAVSLLSAPPAAARFDGPAGLRMETGTDMLNWGWSAGRIKRWATRRRIASALAMAEAGGGDAHLWLHPFNLTETSGLMTYVDAVLDRIARARDRRAVAVVPFTA